MAKKPTTTALTKPMTTGQYLAGLEALDLPIIGAQKLGVSRRTAQRVASGRTEVPGPLAVLIRLLIHRKIPVEELEKLE